jgi:hypothetical protein
MFDTHESAGQWLLSLRIENANDARLASWLQELVGTQAVRDAAHALESRKRPRPLKVAKALGLEVPPELAQTEAVPPLHVLRQHDEARRHGWPQPFDGR